MPYFRSLPIIPLYLRFTDRCQPGIAVEEEEGKVSNIAILHPLPAKGSTRTCRAQIQQPHSHEAANNTFSFTITTLTIQPTKPNQPISTKFRSSDSIHLYLSCLLPLIQCQRPPLHHPFHLSQHSKAVCPPPPAPPGPNTSSRWVPLLPSSALRRAP
jgi:hypothetical protein